MSHVPVSTLMERVKILTDIRKKEIIFSDSFDKEKMSKQVRDIACLKPIQFKTQSITN